MASQAAGGLSNLDPGAPPLKRNKWSKLPVEKSLKRHILHILQIDNLCMLAAPALSS